MTAGSVAAPFEGRAGVLARASRSRRDDGTTSTSSSWTTRSGSETTHAIRRSTWGRAFVRRGALRKQTRAATGVPRREEIWAMAALALFEKYNPPQAGSRGGGARMATASARRDTRSRRPPTTPGRVRKSCSRPGAADRPACRLDLVGADIELPETARVRDRGRAHGAESDGVAVHGPVDRTGRTTDGWCCSAWTPTTPDEVERSAEGAAVPRLHFPTGRCPTARGRGAGGGRGGRGRRARLRGGVDRAPATAATARRERNAVIPAAMTMLSPSA